MYAKDLIGKTCIREKPVIKTRYAQRGGRTYLMFGSGEEKIEEPDYTYCSEPVNIIAATDHNIVCEVKSIVGKPYIVNLDERYCDDNWVDYDALLGGYHPQDDSVAEEPEHE